MAFTPNASATRTVGIAKQTAFGTPAASPTYFLRVTSFEGTVDAKTLKDGAFTGDFAENHQAVPGTSHFTIDGKGSIYLDTVGFFLAGVLGGVANFTAGVNPAPNTWDLALTESEPSYYTMFDKTAAGVFVYQDIAFSDLTLSGSTDKLAEISFKGTGTQVTSGTATASFTTELPMTHWGSTVSVGASSGAAVVATSADWSFDIKRELHITPGGGGSRYPQAITPTTCTVTGKVTATVNGTDLSEHTAYLAGTARYVSVSLSNGGTESLKAEFLNAYYDANPVKVGTMKDVITWEGDFEGVAAPTTLTGASGLSSPVQITLLNMVPTGTY